MHVEMIYDFLDISGYIKNTLEMVSPVFFYIFKWLLENLKLPNWLLLFYFYLDRLLYSKTILKVQFEVCPPLSHLSGVGVR